MSKSFLIQAAVVAAFAAVVAGLLMKATPDIRMWTIGLLFAALADSVYSAWSLRRALRQTDKVFYSVWGWGSLRRLGLLGASALLLVRAGVPPAIPLITLASAFLASHLAQIPSWMRPVS